MMLLLSTRVWISDKTGSKPHRLLLLSGDTPAISLPDGSAAEAGSLLSGSIAPPPPVTYSKSETRLASHSSVPVLAVSPHAPADNDSASVPSPGARTVS